YYLLRYSSWLNDSYLCVQTTVRPYLKDSLFQGTFAVRITRFDRSVIPWSDYNRKEDFQLMSKYQPDKNRVITIDHKNIGQNETGTDPTRISIPSFPNDPI
ncbi:MAG: hypothetical protein AAGH79_18280, partial [Bacteroidota bacterium]